MNYLVVLIEIYQLISIQNSKGKKMFYYVLLVPRSTNQIAAFHKYTSTFLPMLIINPLRPNNDLSQTSHCNIKGLSVREVMRIENMITQVIVY